MTCVLFDLKKKKASIVSLEEALQLLHRMAVSEKRASQPYSSDVGHHMDMCTCLSFLGDRLHRLTNVITQRKTGLHDWNLLECY